MPATTADTTASVAKSKKKSATDGLPLLFVGGFILNYVLLGLGRYGYLLPIPTSVHIELVFVALMIYGGSHAKAWGTSASRAFTSIFGIYIAWTIYSFIEAGNMSSEIEFGTIISRWFGEFRMMTLQVIWIFIINGLFFRKVSQVRAMYRVWAYLTIAAVAWGLRQQFDGFDRTEWQWLYAVGMKTHFVNGIIRYFSFFSDAANYGSCMGASAIVFGALFMTPTPSKRDKIVFGIASLAAVYGMMASGSRSAIFVLAAGLGAFCIVSKRISTLVVTAIVGGLFIGFLMFTQIGQGNSMIRRMRSAFNKDDNSLAVREINKAAMKRYIDAKPFGLGAGIRPNDVPPSNSNHYLATVAPDSTWVYVDIRYGHLGKFLFLLSFGGMIALSGAKVLFKIKDKEVSGQMAAIVAGSFAMFVAGYANQIMMQFPNTWIFFGNLSLVALAEEMEQTLNAERANEFGELMEQELLMAQQSIYPLEAVPPTPRPLDVAPSVEHPLDSEPPAIRPLDANHA